MKNLNSFALDTFASNANNMTSLPDNHDRGNDLYNEVKAIADIIISRHIDITAQYGDWIKLGFALSNGLGENGRELYHKLSSMNAKYNPTECDKKYSSCINSSGHGITVSTFFQMAKGACIDLSTIAKQRVSATYAIPPTAKRIENIGKSTILGSLDNKMAVGGMAEVAETGRQVYTFSDKTTMEDWPSFLHPIFKVHHDTVSRDKMLLGVLNVVSGLMGGASGTADEPSGIYGLYDGRRVYAPLFNIVYGTAGSAKGDMAFCKLLAKPVKNEMHREYEAAKAKYEEELAAYEAENKGKKKGERGIAPKEPAYRDPFTPGNSSSSAVYRAIDANGGWGMMYETEADTISSMIDSDYGNYSDFLRKAFHHETVSMNRVSEKLHIDIENPRLSTFITCTPGQLPSLFPSFENGLGSRFLFYNLPDEELNFHDVFALDDNPLEDIYKQMGDELLPLFHALQARKGHPLHFVLSKAQQMEFVNTYKEILIEQFNMLGIGINAFVFRTALSSFRYAMVLTALRRLSEWNKQDSIFLDDENALVCDDRDFHTALEIVGCLIYHTARVYAVLAKENENPFAQCGIQLTTEELHLYKALPDGEFRTSEFIKIANEQNISERSAQRMLSQMCHVRNVIRPVRRGVYSKAVDKTM